MLLFLYRLGTYQSRVVYEGNESTELQQLLLGNTTIQYYQITSQPTTLYTPRLFYLSSSSGWFIAEELNHAAAPDKVEDFDPFPFRQEDIYDAIQPGMDKTVLCIL